MENLRSEISKEPANTRVPHTDAKPAADLTPKQPAPESQKVPDHSSLSLPKDLPDKCANKENAVG